MWIILKLLIFVQLLLSYSVFCQKKDSSLEISILTCSAGQEIYSVFGHSALRVIDNKNSTDVVYNYGVFDFNNPNFLWEFIKGNLDYELGANDFISFKNYYQALGRNITEQKLYISDSLKEVTYEKLQLNFLPQNKVYRYDFLKNNCSTKIRDLIITSELTNNTISIPLKQTTYRKELKKHLKDHKWIELGVDIALGVNADRKLDFNEYMFLPINLSEALSQLPKVGPPLGIVMIDKSAWNTQHSFFNFSLTPLLIFIILLISVLFLIKFVPNTIKLLNIIFIIYGSIGIIVMLLWFGTSHPATKLNYNLLWLNPLYLIIPLLRPNLKKIAFLIILSINILILTFWQILPQQFNTAIIPLIIIKIALLINNNINYDKLK